MLIRSSALRRFAALPLLWLCASVPVEAGAAPDFFSAALCQPPYSFDHANTLYEAAEKLTKPDMSMMGAAVYHLPAPVTRDGFTTQDVIFAGSAVGVLIEGHVAEELAQKYQLEREKNHLFGASTLGFSRRLPDADQGMKDLGLISLVAREGPAMPGKTMLVCEFDSNEDLEAMKALEKYSSGQ
ncbi:hypothetical protein [Novosphingobium terrae]|uniref:hypothetical protein n=1 Tax=Novosphingobium terrae TaxID=2726189 RepID=UPI00198074DF|nr:hypothetical protein [Novosphingobium terrae]